MVDDALVGLAEQVGRAFKARGWMLALAESCTGGGVAEAVTSVPGSSAWFERGFVTYSNTAKIEMLDVNPQTLDAHGAVSLETVREMAAGALARSHAQVAIAISGIAGPEGGTPGKPVGTVCFAWAIKNGMVHCEQRRLDGDRQSIRRQAAQYALGHLLALSQPAA
ncbi:MAG TPA: CinA family protein [Novimethylophilus sp.]|jgi:nicotinamide-nucleotide amidase|uniref:CinA family protein n=1 Tax=Novimethylophilus sp. TaxID=2137426 RepID=UPI002F3F65C6